MIFWVWGMLEFSERRGYEAKKPADAFDHPSEAIFRQFPMQIHAHSIHVWYIYTYVYHKKNQPFM